MVCPQCGADHGFEECLQPDTAALTFPPLSEPELILNQIRQESEALNGAESAVAKPTSRLITFPGVTRRTMPPWRKEIKERVREAQERRAQEAAGETEAAISTGAEVANQSPPQLELLPQTEAADVNPIVLAALKRIERAYQPPDDDLRPSYPARLSLAAGASDRGAARPEVRQANGTSGNGVGATTVDGRHNELQPGSSQNIATKNPGTAVGAASVSEMFPLSEKELPQERPVNLLVVPAAPNVAEADTFTANPSVPDTAITKPKPKRMISDDATDPALNYLDLVGVAYQPPVDSEKRAPLFSRLMGGAIDLLIVGFLSVPFAALIELQNDNWRDPRVAMFMASAAVVVMFIYFTVSTAMTGKTLGLKIMSLRIIDTRTRLIPTGQQAAGRAIVYILSLATAGFGLLMVLARGEGKTLHDRLSRTAVVRDRA